MAQSYIDTLNVGCYMIDKGQIPDKDIKALAEVLINRIMEHDSPEDAASYVVDQLAKRLKTENDRLLVGYKIKQSKLMADRYEKLLRCIISRLKKMTIKVYEHTEYLLSLSIEPQQKPTEASQQPSEGSGGEMADSDNKTRPEPERAKKPKTIRDRVAGNVDANDLLRKLHTLMDNKSGKDALVYLTICITDGKIYRPTITQFKKEFPNICEKAEYYRYTDSKMYTTEELTAARIAYNTCK